MPSFMHMEICYKPLIQNQKTSCPSYPQALSITNLYIYKRKKNYLTSLLARAFQAKLVRASRLGTSGLRHSAYQMALLAAPALPRCIDRATLAG